MKSLLYLLLIILVVSNIYAQWTHTNGPEGVSISSLATIDGTIYAGTSVEGLYASTDDGLSWIALNAGIENLEVTAVARNQQGYLLAATFGGGVFHSVDNGQSWMAPLNADNLAVTAMVFKDSLIFAGTIDNGVFRSSDNGVTWTQKLSGFISVMAMCVSGNTIFVSTYGYTYASTDNGESWFDVSTLEGAAIWSFYCQDSLIMAGGVNQIYRSTNYGNSFTPLSLNFPFSVVNIYSISAIGSTFYMATSYDGVYKSTDDGSTWVPANDGMGPKDVRAITATNSSTLIAGTHYVGIYRSTDMGLQWSKSVTGFPAGSSILSLIEYGSSVFTGTRDGAYRTDDNGDNWVKLAGTNDTTKYGDVWDMCELDGVIYASMQLYFDASVYKSTDNGGTWIRCGNAGFPPGLSFIKGLVASGNNIIAATDEGIYYSPDEGSNWYQTNIPNLHIPSIAAAGSYAYAPVSGAGIYRSSDNGINWSLSLQSTVDYIEVAAIDNYAFAGSFFEGGRYSSNYGSTWFVSGGFPADASVFELGPLGNGILLAGTDLEPNWIYVSYNNGASFSSYSEGLGQRAAVEAFTANDSFMFAGTDYNGVWRRLRPGLVNIKPPSDVPKTFYLAQNYPNPFNLETVIKYSLPIQSKVTLKIYNVLGEEVRTLVDEVQTLGLRTINWNGQDNHGKPVSSGIYLYRIKAGVFTATKKMVLVE
jgi:photosystem II stability/assembly factor-like uncharacterized protein